MKWLLAFLFPLNALASWILNPSLPTPSDVTPNIKTENLSAYCHAFYTLSDGTPHLMLGFDGSSAQLWDVNLSNSVSTVLTATNSSLFTWPTVVTFSNTVILSGRDSGYTYEFDPSAKTITKILTNSENIMYSSCRSPDGVIFMGTYGRMYVDWWNPSNRVAGTYGVADPNVPITEVGDYLYYIVADTNHVYCSLRGYIPDWYMTVIDRTTTNRTYYWNGTNTTQVALYNGLDGNFYASSITNGNVAYWQLSNGVPLPMSLVQWLAVSKYDAYFEDPGVNRDIDNWNTETGWEFDISATAYSVDNGTPSCSLRWKKTNDVVWASFTETNNWLPVASGIQIMRPWTSGSQLWITPRYGPVGSFVPGGSASVLGSWKGQSSYDVLQISSNEAYISGYFLSTLRWNPSSAWTRTPSVQDLTSTNYNPYTFDSTGGNHHAFMALGSDGRLFTASLYDRSGVGGGLAWYNRSTGALGLEHTTFIAPSDTPSDLKTAESSTKLVWCSWGGNIFIWDVSTFTQITNFSLTGSSAMDKVCEYQSGKLFGISETNTFGFTTSGSILWTSNIPATVYGSTPRTQTDTWLVNLTLGPDGFVWIPYTTHLYRLNPINGSYSNVLNITSGPNKIMFNSGDAYLYGGSQTYQLKDLLVSIADIKATTLRVGTLRGP